MAYSLTTFQLKQIIFFFKKSREKTLNKKKKVLKFLVKSWNYLKILGGIRNEGKSAGAVPENKALLEDFIGMNIMTTESTSYQLQQLFYTLKGKKISKLKEIMQILRDFEPFFFKNISHTKGPNLFLWMAACRISTKTIPWKQGGDLKLNIIPKTWRSDGLDYTLSAKPDRPISSKQHSLRGLPLTSFGCGPAHLRVVWQSELLI